MSTYDYIEIALRHDTLMSWAMLKACGVTREQGRAIVKAARVEYGGMRECFENRTHVRIGYGSL